MRRGTAVLGMVLGVAVHGVSRGQTQTPAAQQNDPATKAKPADGTNDGKAATVPAGTPLGGATPEGAPVVTGKAQLKQMEKNMKAQIKQAEADRKARDKADEEGLKDLKAQDKAHKRGETQDGARASGAQK